MIRNFILPGYRTAWRNPGLVLSLWVANLMPGVLAVAPLWRWWSAAFDRAPEADRALDHFSLGLLRELAHYDRSPVWGIALAAFVSAGLISLVCNPLMNGGAMEVLLSRDQRPLLSRFWSGAGRYFLRYLGLLALSLVMGAVTVILFVAGTRMALRPLANSGWEPGSVIASLCAAAVALAVAAFFYMVLDYARIDVAMSDACGILRAWIRAVSFVCCSVLRCFGILIAVALAFAALMAVYALYSSLVPAKTWALIALTFVVQQLLVYARVGLRTSLLAAELELFSRQRMSSAADIPQR